MYLARLASCYVGRDVTRPSVDEIENARLGQCASESGEEWVPLAGGDQGEDDLHRTSVNSGQFLGRM
jgi:hypothetical protein